MDDQQPLRPLPDRRLAAVLLAHQQAPDEAHFLRSDIVEEKRPMTRASRRSISRTDHGSQVTAERLSV